MFFSSKIHTLSDARFFSGMGAHWLGIQADPTSPYFLSPERFKEIAGWVSGPEFILEVHSMGNQFDPDLLFRAYGIEQFCILPHQVEKLFGKKAGIQIEDDSSAIQLNEPLFIRLQDITQLDRFKNHTCPILVPDPQNLQKTKELMATYPNIGFIVEGSPEKAVGIAEYSSMELLEYLDSLR